MNTASKVIRLDQACSIQIGYTARGRLEPMEGGVRALQLRDTSPQGGLSPTLPGRFRLDDVPDRYLVGPGDVVFRSRGDCNTAALIDEAFGEPAIAVMPLVILRVGNGVQPEYLAWYLNQPEAQHHFDRGARGTKIRMIPMDCLVGLPVPVPDLATQRAIGRLHGLISQEFALATQHAEKRRQLLSIALLKAAHESTHTHHSNTPVASRPAKGGKP